MIGGKYIPLRQIYGKEYENGRKVAELFLDIQDEKKRFYESPAAKNKDKNAFVQKLYVYAETRYASQVIKHDDVNTINRFEFIREVIQALQDSRTDKIDKLLDEGKIKPFKGFFTSRLYTHCADCRNKINNEDDLNFEF